MATKAKRLIMGMLLMGTLACKEQILHDLDEPRANQVQLLLLSSAIQAEKIRSGKLWSVAVARSDVPQALFAIERSRILRRDLEHAAEQQGGFLQSSEERLRLHERQLAARTEQTLEQIPGVLEARVHLHRSPDAKSVLGRSPERNTASVLLVLKRGAAVDAHEVRALVAGAAGFQDDEVTVLSRAVPEGEEPQRVFMAAKSPSVPGPSPQLWLGAYTGACAGAGAAVLLSSGLIAASRRKRRLQLLPEKSKTPGAEASRETSSRFQNVFPFSDLEAEPLERR